MRTFVIFCLCSTAMNVNINKFTFEQLPMFLILDLLLATPSAAASKIPITILYYLQYNTYAIYVRVCVYNCMRYVTFVFSPFNSPVK